MCGSLPWTPNWSLLSSKLPPANNCLTKWSKPLVYERYGSSDYSTPIRKVIWPGSSCTKRWVSFFWFALLLLFSCIYYFIILRRSYIIILLNINLLANNQDSITWLSSFDFHDHQLISLRERERDKKVNSCMMFMNNIIV